MRTSGVVVEIVLGLVMVFEHVREFVFVIVLVEVVLLMLLLLLLGGG